MPILVIVKAEPVAEAAALTRLVGCCLRYAPLVGIAAPDGLWLDVTGCTHLAGGEAALPGPIWP